MRLIETLTGKTFTPEDACNWSMAHGYKALGNGPQPREADDEQIIDLAELQLAGAAAQLLLGPSHGPQQPLTDLGKLGLGIDDLERFHKPA